MLRIVVLPLFLVLLALSGGCQHPCQANPEQCPSLRLEVKGEPPVEAYPGLIQRRAPNPVVDITVSTSDQSKFGEVTAYLCPPGSSCREGCPDSKRPLTLQASLLSADGQGQTYLIPKEIVTQLPLGPARLCVSILSESLPDIRVYNWKDIWVVNQLVKVGESKNHPHSTSGPVSFDIDPQQRFLLVGQISMLRKIYQYSYPNFGTAGKPFTFSGNPFTPNNPSVQFLSRKNVNLLVAQYDPIQNNQPVVFKCDLGMTDACTTPDPKNDMGPPPGWNITESGNDSVTDMADDSLSERFIVAQSGSTTTVLAIDSKLDPTQKLQVPWKSTGLVGPVMLLAAPLRRLSDRKVSDVVAVGKTAASLDERSVMVFLAEEAANNPNVLADMSFSAALSAAMKQALGDRQLVAMSAGDLDDDGLAEIVLLSKSASDARLHILFNLGNGSLRIAGDLINPETKTELEKPLKSMVTLTDAVDVKVQNLDGASPAQLRPEIVVLGTKSIQIHRLE